MIKCKYCKASNNEEANSCVNCGAFLPKRSDLNEKEKQILSNYIKSVEEMLKASKDIKDTPIFISFILLAFVLVAEVIALNHYTNMGGFMMFLVTIVFAVFLFIIFGFIVVRVEDNAVNKAYNQRIKAEIEDYLTQMHFEKIDFKVVANEVLPKNASLYKFLDEY